MLVSKGIAVVLVGALMLSNIACACGMAIVSSGDHDPGVSEHHQAAGSDAPGDMPCVHRDCEGCEDPQDTCATLDYIASSPERDIRATLLVHFDFDSPDKAFIDSDVDPPGTHDPRKHAAALGSLEAVLSPDTPVLRKDQLTE